MAGYELTPEEIKLFLEEASEQVQIMEETLIALEEDPDNPGLIQEIFRAAHTLKGGSATAGFDNMARLTHAMESLLDQVRQGEREMSSEIADPLFEGVDLLRRCLAEIAQVGHAENIDVTPLIAALEEQIGAGAAPPAAPGRGAAATKEAPGATGAGEAAPAWDPTGGQGQQAWWETIDRPYGEAADAGWVPAQDPSPAAGVPVAVEVQIAPTALMSSVRAYQVLLVLQDYGEVLWSEPSRQAIESGTAEVRRVRATLRLKEPGAGGDPERLESLERALLEIPEIVSASVAKAVSADGEAGATRADASGAEAPTPQAPAPAAASAPVPAASPEGEGKETREAATSARGGAGGSTASTASAASAASLGQTIRVDVTLLDNLMNLVGELVIDRTRLAQLAMVDMSADELKEELTGVSSSLSRITTDLQDTIMHARMMPVDTLFKKFPRLVRDLSRQLGKEVDFEMSGNETELDRSVIEQIGDPLIHLLRNAIDHGIEPAEERRQKGKSPRGKVRLHAYHQENHIYIQVSDDGRGLNAEKILRKAIERGLVRPDEASRLSRETIYEFIFAPGFSTAAEVSSVSGRGVGMDVVKRNLEKVNGSVTVVTEEGRGTTFTIKLPLTLVIVQALMVEIAQSVMAIPLSNVTEAVQVTSADIHYARGWEMIEIRGEMVPLLNPGAIWGSGWSVEPPPGKALPVVILRSGSSPLGLKVNRLLGEQEIVIKAMGPVIGNVPGISGASILGDGSVALIIDPAGLSKAVKQAEAAERTA